eukprot:gene12861-15199_t
MQAKLEALLVSEQSLKWKTAVATAFVDAQEVLEIVKEVSGVLGQENVLEKALSSDEDSRLTLLNKVPDNVDLPGILLTGLEDETDPGWDCVALTQMILQDNPIATKEHETRRAVEGQAVQVTDDWTLELPYLYNDLVQMLVASGCHVSDQLAFGNDNHIEEMGDLLLRSAACTETTNPSADLDHTPQRWGSLMSFKAKNKRLQPELAFFSTVKSMLYEMPKECPYADAICTMYPDTSAKYLRLLPRQ